MADIRQTQVGTTTYDIEPQSAKGCSANNVVKLNSSKKFVDSKITDDGSTINLKVKTTIQDKVTLQYDTTNECLNFVFV